MKIAVVPVVREYELTYLMPASKTTAEQSVLAEKIANEIKNAGGEISTQEEWGKRDLAYAIKHNKQRHTEAVYVHVVFSMDSVKVPSFESQLRLNQELLRYLLVGAEKVSK